MEEISLKDIITIIWKSKWLIAIITTVCIVIGLVYCLFIMSDSYEAEAVLNVTPIKSNSTGTIDTVPDIVAYLANEPANSIELYSAQIKMDSVLAVAAETIGLDKSSGDYLNSLRSKVTVNSTEKTNMINIRFNDSNGKTAVNGANAVADAFVKYVSEAINVYFNDAYDFISQQYENEDANLSESIGLLNEFLSQERGVTEVQNELDSHISLINSHKNNLMDLEITINYNEAGLAAASNLLSDTPALVDVINDSVSEQVQNSSYAALVNIINDYKIAISVDKAKFKLYEKSLKDLQRGIADLQIELNFKKSESDELNAEYLSSKEALDLYQSELEAIEIKLAADIGSKSVVKIADAVGYKSVGTSKAMIMIIVAIIGVMLGVFAVFIIYSWKSDTSGDEISKDNIGIE